jgi:hypothetical protein
MGLNNGKQIMIKNQGVIETEFNWKLVRERDGLTKQSKDSKWIRV